MGYGTHAGSGRRPTASAKKSGALQKQDADRTPYNYVLHARELNLPLGTIHDLRNGAR
jgi:hypothetical protein